MVTKLKLISYLLNFCLPVVFVQDSIIKVEHFLVIRFPYYSIFMEWSFNVCIRIVNLYLKKKLYNNSNVIQYSCVVLFIIPFIISPVQNTVRTQNTPWLVANVASPFLSCSNIARHIDCSCMRFQPVISWKDSSQSSKLKNLIWKM